MIELLVAGGVLAVVGLAVIAGAYLLYQRRTGTVRAVVFPRRAGVSRPQQRPAAEPADGGEQQ